MCTATVTVLVGNYGQHYFTGITDQLNGERKEFGVGGLSVGRGPVALLRARIEMQRFARQARYPRLNIVSAAKILVGWGLAPGSNWQVYYVKVLECLKFLSALQEIVVSQVRPPSW